MASNYDIPKLGLGLSAAASSMVLAIGATYAFVSRGGGSGLTQLAPISVITITYGIMMFASSYVEEEHHFWYWSTSAWLALVGWRSLSAATSNRSTRQPRQHAFVAVVAIVATFTAIRLLRGWNQTGQKFAGEPDLVKTFLQPNPRLLWTLVTATYALIGLELVQGFSVFPAAITAPAVFILVLSALSFKLIFTYEDSPELVGSFARALVELIERVDGGSTGSVTLITRARVVFTGLAIAAGAAVYSIVVSKRLQNNSKTALTRPAVNVLLPLYTLLAVTQSRTTNTPLFLLFGIVYRFMAAQKQNLAPTEITTATVLLQFASFFAFGGTNAISSVDLSSAYNGISGFSAGAVGVLIFVSNWAGSIYWAVASTLLLSQQSNRPSSPSYSWLQHASLLTVFAAASAVAVMAACTALRTHLFVWTVFSPKYLYCIAWSLGMHLGTNLGLGGLLYWLGTSS